MTIPQTRPTNGSDGIFSLANDHLTYSSVFPRIAGGGSKSVPSGGLLQGRSHIDVASLQCCQPAGAQTHL